MALVVLSSLSQEIETQSKLIEMGILTIMCNLLREHNDTRLRREAC